MSFAELAKQSGLTQEFGSMYMSLQQSCLSALPEELKDRLLYFLPEADRLVMRLVSCVWKDAVEGHSLWAAACKRCKQRPLPTKWQPHEQWCLHVPYLRFVRRHLAPASGTVDPCEAMEHMAHEEPQRQLQQVSGTDEAVLALMRHGVEFAHTERRTGRSPLHIAAKLGNPELVELFLDIGIPVNSLCRFGSTALHWAVRSGSLATCSALLAWNRPSAKLKTQEDTAEQPFEAMLGSFERTPMIPLTEAALPEAPVEVEVAREMAWINVVEEKTFATPLHLAARKDRGDMVAMLLHYAYLCDDRDMSDTMGYKRNRMANRSAKSLVNARTSEGSSLLHYLSDSGHVDLLNWCLQHGGIVDLPNKNGQTPLFWAAFADQPKTAQLLLLRGADLHKQDRLHANTPLHTAAMKGSLACIKVLVRDGGDVSRANKEGLTPVGLARATGNFQCADWMEAHAFERYSTFKQKKRQSIWTPQIPEFAADRTKVRSGSSALVRRASFMGESRQKAPTFSSRASSRTGAAQGSSGPFAFRVPKDRPRSMMLHTKFRQSAILRATATVSDSSLAAAEELQYPDDLASSAQASLATPGVEEEVVEEEEVPVPTIAVLEDAGRAGWNGSAKRQGINTERWQAVAPFQGLPADCEPPPPAPW